MYKFTNKLKKVDFLGGAGNIQCGGLTLNGNTRASNNSLLLEHMFA